MRAKRDCMGDRRWVLGVLGVVVLAACGGGGGSVPVVAQSLPPGFVAPTPGPARAFSGTRTIAITGSPPSAIPRGSYTIAEIDQDLPPPGGAPNGTVIARRAVRTYTGTAPAGGILLQTETRDDDLGVGSGGLVLLSSNDVVIGRDIDAERSSPFSAPFIDTRTTATTYAANATVVPPPAGSAQLAFPLAATVHLTERNLGTNGASSRGTDYIRIVRADGSYDETGRFSDVGVHSMNQRADGSAASHDQLPGFSLRDVAIAAPSSSALAVTIQSQGRTVGNPPIVTSTFTTPVWYLPAALAGATLYETAYSSPPPECALPASQPVWGVNLARGRVDVAAGVLFVENDVNYVDGSGQTLCRDTVHWDTYFDITTGAVTGFVDDRTIVHFTGNASTSVGFGAKRRL